MPTPVILFYSPTPQAYTPKLFQLCAVQSVKFRRLESGDLDRALLSLSQAFHSAEPCLEGEALPEPLLIFCHLSPRQLDRALASLRKLRVSCLKAVLTPTNAQWTLRELYGELCKERSQLGGVHSSQP
jgi:hypothetical protein